MSQIPVNEVLLEVRHQAWTPENFDGTTPATSGTGALVANGWQPFALGDTDHVQGTGANTITFRADAGLMIRLGGFGITEQIDDHTGDGDDGTQRRPVNFRDPQNRSLEMIIPAQYRGLARFINTVRNDAVTPKRPFDLRETFFTRAAIGSNLLTAAAYTTGHQGPINIDGSAVPNLRVGDLITFGAATTVYRIEGLTSTTMTLTQPLAANVADNTAVNRAVSSGTRVGAFYIGGYTESREAKNVLMIQCDLVPHSPPTETGLN